MSTESSLFQKRIGSSLETDVSAMFDLQPHSQQDTSSWGLEQAGPNICRLSQVQREAPAQSPPPFSSHLNTVHSVCVCGGLCTHLCPDHFVRIPSSIQPPPPSTTPLATSQGWQCLVQQPGELAPSPRRPWKWNVVQKGGVLQVARLSSTPRTPHPAGRAAARAGPLKSQRQAEFCGLA